MFTFQGQQRTRKFTKAAKPKVMSNQTLTKQVKALKKQTKEYFPTAFNVFNGVTLTANTLDLNLIDLGSSAGNGAKLRGMSIEIQYQGVAAGAVATHSRIMVVRDNEAENTTAISAAELLSEDTPFAIYNSQRCYPPKDVGIKKGDPRLQNNPILFDELRYDILYDKRFFQGAAGSANEDKDLSIYIPLHDVLWREDDNKYYVCCISDQATIVDCNVVVHIIQPVDYSA